MDADIVLFSGNANKSLANKICDWLDIPLGDALVSQYSDGETRIELRENVRGRDVYIVQSCSAPVNHHIMEAVLMADAAHRASAARVTLVAPYFGYARQERKSAPRTPISAKLVSDMIEASGYNRVLTLELHNSAIQGFFNIAVDHLYANAIFYNYYKNLDNILVVSPDAGGVERARALAKLFNCGLAIVDKRRDRPNESSVMNIIGEVKGKNCVIIDDMVDTAGSLTKACEALLEQGALSVVAAISHPVLSGPAIERISQSSLKELVVTDSIQLSEEAQQCSKIKPLSIAQLFGKAIRRIHNDDSISALFV